MDGFAAQLSPLLERLSVLHNFTIESQVQYHGPLAFEPRELQVAEKTQYGLMPEDLTVFVNSAEWTLCAFFVLRCSATRRELNCTSIKCL